MRLICKDFIVVFHIFNMNYIISHEVNEIIQNGIIMFYTNALF